MIFLYALEAFLQGVLLFLLGTQIILPLWKGEALFPLVRRWGASREVAAVRETLAERQLREEAAALLERVLAAAQGCSTARATLKALFPEVFPLQVEIGEETALTAVLKDKDEDSHPVAVYDPDHSDAVLLNNLEDIRWRLKERPYYPANPNSPMRQYLVPDLPRK